MNVSASDETTQVAALREAMIGELRELGAIRSDSVAAAVGAVPRHLFAPGEPLDAVYAATRAIVTKRNEHGAALSSLSESHIQATMLEQAEIEPGMRVLEIGSGGYNAALIAELVGESGEVISVDIDPDIVERARRYLAAAGYEKVDVVLADAEHGAPDQAPYDRVIVTAGAWDVPPAWSDQLAEGGRIVVPLRMRGLTRSVTFEHEGDHLVSRDYRLCGFVPMQGSGAHSERVVALDGTTSACGSTGSSRLMRTACGTPCSAREWSAGRAWSSARARVSLSMTWTCGLLLLWTVSVCLRRRQN